MSNAVTVTVTGAAGQIGYATLFRIASGDMLGPNTKIRLKLLEIPQAVKAAEAVAMELHDCAFPLLHDIDVTDSLKTGFDRTSIALLIGARPRGKGMERADLLAANGEIFTAQGQALNDYAADDVRVLVVGNPANTNALIASAHAPDIPPERFNAMTRLDHNRAMGQIAEKTHSLVTSIARVTIWGNHSAGLYPDIEHATIYGRPARDVINDDEWVENEFIPGVAKRGAKIIEARGQSSAASAAHAAIDHIYEWVYDSTSGNWASVALPSDGSYDVPEGLFSSFPAMSRRGRWEIVQGLHINEFSRPRIDSSVAELIEEREAVKSLGLI